MAAAIVRRGTPESSSAPWTAWARSWDSRRFICSLPMGSVLPTAGGDCPAGTLALYRLYNNGRNGAPNHRYTKRLDLRSEMLGQGFVAEGFGDLGVAGCVPT